MALFNDNMLFSSSLVLHMEDCHERGRNQLLVLPWFMKAPFECLFVFFFYISYHFSVSLYKLPLSVGFLYVCFSGSVVGGIDEYVTC